MWLCICHDKFRFPFLSTVYRANGFGVLFSHINEAAQGSQQTETLPPYPMNSPGPTATDIQSHLYNSFIQGSTHDVAIRVSGNWSALYKLHRVVLIQSVWELARL